jgi:alpha-beta hydrolase superfamily lysophospholipase
LSTVLKELPDHRRQDISLVTVSMGGLISQTMIETPELYVDGVKRLIACVPPFQGSELATLRFLVEIGDQTMNFFDPRRVANAFGDGMGRAGIDLHPDSLFMEKRKQLERNPNVTYSILAGNQGFVDATVLARLHRQIQEEKTINGFNEAMRRISLERVELLMDFQTGKGDGAVKLESATLDGVDDRVVLPVHHLQILTDLTRKDPPPGFEEMVKRLPPTGDSNE